MVIRKVVKKTVGAGRSVARHVSPVYAGGSKVYHHFRPRKKPEDQKRKRQGRLRNRSRRR